MAQDMSNDVSWALYPRQLVSSSYPSTCVLVCPCQWLLVVVGSCNTEVTLLSTKDMFVPVEVIIGRCGQFILYHSCI